MVIWSTQTQAAFITLAVEASGTLVVLGGGEGGKSVAVEVRKVTQEPTDIDLRMRD